MKTYEVLLEYAKQSSLTYIKNIQEEPVYPTKENLTALQTLEEELPINGTNPLTVLQLLANLGAKATPAQTGGRFFGFVTGGLLPIAHSAEWIADTWNQNSALAVMSPITAKLEDLCEKWIVSLLGLPEETAMGLVSGSSHATLCALAAARNSLLAKAGYNIQRYGLRNAPPLHILISEDAHATVKSALSILGFGENEIEIVPTDRYGRMRIDAIPTMDSHTLCILQAGNVNGGSYDPIDAICDKANKAGAWVHIDGAIGLWAAASQKYRHLTKGLEKADSWSVDAHKTLNAGYDSGIVLCRHREAFVSALQAKGAYISYSKQRDGMLYTTEMSRRARAIPLWALLKSLGAKGVENLINQLCERTEYFATQLKSAGFHVINPVFFNQFMIDCETDEETKSLLQNIQQSGICWCSGSHWKGKPIIRISVSSHATTKEDIDQSVKAFKKAFHHIQNT